MILGIFHRSQLAWTAVGLPSQGLLVCRLPASVKQSGCTLSWSLLGGFQRKGKQPIHWSTGPGEHVMDIGTPASFFRGCCFPRKIGACKLQRAAHTALYGPMDLVHQLRFAFHELRWSLLKRAGVYSAEDGVTLDQLREVQALASPSTPGGVSFYGAFQEKNHRSISWGSCQAASFDRKNIHPFLPTSFQLRC